LFSTKLGNRIIYFTDVYLGNSKKQTSGVPHSVRVTQFGALSLVSGLTHDKY